MRRTGQRSGSPRALPTPVDGPVRVVNPSDEEILIGMWWWVAPGAFKMEECVVAECS